MPTQNLNPDYAARQDQAWPPDTSRGDMQLLFAPIADSLKGRHNSVAYAEVCRRSQLFMPKLALHDSASILTVYGIFLLICLLASPDENVH